ncbi:hypothetical protein CRI93_11930 [Longimonas halophila]|uniref:Uncharacterized protein n=2 Tax=Longimonas halophila TaxID=1469170 RepID=A0A2H3NR66_9BACT|nr:hypothetical protein CRI93_11930 [Longimonas halophila]
MIPTLLIGMALIVATAVLPPLTQAQSENEAPSPGDWALQFQVNDNFTLGSFQGSVLSVKHQITDQRALRLGTSFDVTSRSREINEDAIADGPDSDDEARQQFQIDAQYLYTSDRESAIRPYAGGGPTFLMRRTRDERQVSAGTQEGTNRSYGGGLVGVFGVEWMVHSAIGISAEYGVQAIYTHESREIERNGTTILDATDTEWNVGDRPVLFGVSVYF